jgi:hypothetical protein
MDGYRVVGADGEGIGRVAAVEDDFVIVELGRFRRVRRPVPLAFAHPDDGARIVRITVPRHGLAQAPRVRSAVDVAKAAAYYGLVAP